MYHFLNPAETKRSIKGFRKLQAQFNMVRGSGPTILFGVKIVHSRSTLVGKVKYEM